MKAALIAGATGLIGKQLLGFLLNSGHYSSVIALTRTPLSIQHQKLHNIIGSFNSLLKIRRVFLFMNLWKCNIIKRFRSRYF